MFPEIALSATTITWIAAVISLAVGLAIKDFITSAVSGFMFWIDGAFQEGDKVYIDGEEAIIVKCGLRRTVFGVENGRGYTWRYVQNTRIQHLKLEKVIIPKEQIDSAKNSGNG